MNCSTNNIFKGATSRRIQRAHDSSETRVHDTSNAEFKLTTQVTTQVTTQETPQKNLSFETYELIEAFKKLSVGVTLSPKPM
jgi:hypothetical protein